MVAALLLAAGATQADNRIPPSVALYGRAVSDITIEVERVFDLGEQAAQDLLRGDLGRYSEKELTAVAKQMPGYALSNSEAILALPRVSFFLDLSRRRGGPADVAFFEAMAVEMPDQSYMPGYIQQTTDVQGCLRLDGALTRIDGSWRRYRDAYPRSYVLHVAKHLDNIEKQISSSYEYKRVCACGDLPEAERELAGLARLGPQDRLGKSAADLLRGLRDRIVTFNAHCQPN